MVTTRRRGETVRMRSKCSFRNRVWRAEKENENIPSEKSSFRLLPPQITLYVDYLALIFFYKERGRQFTT